MAAVGIVDSMSLRQVVRAACFLTALTAVVCKSCVYTDTHCACALRTVISNVSSCYDYVSDIAGSAEKRCRRRGCRDGYECDCDGTSYCEHSSEVRSVLQPLGDGRCEEVIKAVNSVRLVAGNLSDVVAGAMTNRGGCVFNESRCNCASKSDIGIAEDCYDFLYQDAGKGMVCRVRDCKESMVCDCGGSKMCLRELKTRRALRKRAEEGRPGFALCEYFESTSDVVTLDEPMASPDERGSSSTQQHGGFDGQL